MRKTWRLYIQIIKRLKRLRAGHLLAKDLAKKITLFKETLSSAKKIVHTFKQKHIAKQVLKCAQLKKKAKKVNSSYFVETRWSSVAESF